MYTCRVHNDVTCSNIEVKPNTPINKHKQTKTTPSAHSSYSYAHSSYSYAYISYSYAHCSYSCALSDC